jgi:hypothetical protein
VKDRVSQAAVEIVIEAAIERESGHDVANT